MTGAPSDNGATSEPDDRAGQTGSPGQAECESDPDCEGVAQRYISSVLEAAIGHRSASCEAFSCRIVYTSAAGCSSSVSGPFFDCALDDAEIFESYRQATTPAPDLCETSSEPGATCTGSEPAPRFIPRDPGEWQGMLIQSGPGPYCEQSDTCGLARACVDGGCTGCSADSQCAQGEGCVLDHCVRQELIGCRRAADCGGGSLCLLSGYTGGTPRGNEDMRAYCNGNGGGSAGSSGMAD